MRRTRLFLFTVLLGLWLALFGAFLFLLGFEARSGGIDVPFAGISIHAEPNTTIHLPNRLFTCTETDQQSQCQTDIQGRPLVIVLEKSSNSELSHCQAQYDGNSLVCLSWGLNYAPLLSESFELTGLGLSPQQLETLQQKYWGTNQLLTLSDRKLMKISQWLAIAAGVIAAYFAWFYPSRLSRGLAIVTGGLITYQWVRGALASVPYATVTPYGLTSATWDRVVDSGAIAAGALVVAIVALLLRHRTNRVTKTFVTLSNGLGGAWIIGYVLVFALIGSGFVD
ncbi:MAG: hypothetical protein AAF722_02415 [Cyanobacteria bacterium P01_C01_bin.70]